jgi:hypothetical protein
MQRRIGDAAKRGMFGSPRALEQLSFECVEDVRRGEPDMADTPSRLGSAARANWQLVQAALFLSVRFPPPTPGALGLVGRDSARTRRAANR